MAAHLDWNPSALRNTSQMELSNGMKDSITYSDMPEELPAFGTVCQQGDIQIQKLRAEMAAQNMGGGTGFVYSPRPPASPNDSAGAPSGTVAEYTGPAPMVQRVGRRKISVEESAKRFTDERCLYRGGINHRVADCAARKKAQTFKAAGAEVKEVGTRTSSKEPGKEQVN